jgi:hypothetical protein
MYLINEDLARVHIRERQREAQDARAAYELLSVRKERRKADEANPASGA